MELYFQTEEEEARMNGILLEYFGVLYQKVEDYTIDNDDLRLTMVHAERGYEMRTVPILQMHEAFLTLSGTVSFKQTSFPMFLGIGDEVVALYYVMEDGAVEENGLERIPLDEIEESLRECQEEWLEGKEDMKAMSKQEEKELEDEYEKMRDEYYRDQKEAREEAKRTEHRRKLNETEAERKYQIKTQVALAQGKAAAEQRKRALENQERQRKAKRERGMKIWGGLDEAQKRILETDHLFRKIESEECFPVHVKHGADEKVWKIVEAAPRRAGDSVTVYKRGEDPRKLTALLSELSSRVRRLQCLE